MPFVEPVNDSLIVASNNPAESNDRIEREGMTSSDNMDSYSPNNRMVLYEVTPDP